MIVRTARIGARRIHVVLVCVGLCAICNLASGEVVSTAVPTDDAFVREVAPTLNYGAAGGLAVAGPDAVNGNGDPQGRFDSVIKFDTAQAVADFDAAYGAGSWTISSVLLEVSEQGAPNNPIFNRGVGDFEVLWLDDDTWVEGPGTPKPPYEGTGDEITWNLLQTILGSATEASLGVFANEGADGRRSYSLALEAPFLADISAGGLVSLHTSPVSDTIGFTFSSVNNTWDDPPELVITAVPEPATMFLVAMGCLLAGRPVRTRDGGTQCG